MDTKPETTIRGGVHVEQRHDSAHKHVTGAAEYTDDIAEPIGTLHAYLGLADKAHAEIVAVDLDAVRSAPGVVGVLTSLCGMSASVSTQTTPGAVRTASRSIETISAWALSARPR